MSWSKDRDIRPAFLPRDVQLTLHQGTMTA